MVVPACKKVPGATVAGSYGRRVGATRVAGAVLAAGAGRRMGAPKAGLVVAGARLLDHAIAALRASGCAPLWAVVRAGTAVEGAAALVNPDPERGMRSSLVLAVDAAEAHEQPVDALAVLLVDLPGVGADAIAATVAAWRPGRIVIATFAGRRGHPTVMAPSLWRAALASAGPDEGARRFLHAHPRLVDEIAVAGDANDLDTPDDVRRWTTRTPPPPRRHPN